MLTFHNCPSIKDKYIQRLKEHTKADEIIKGKYWENGKGCAIGCTIHSKNHSEYEIELGIPVWLAYVEDKIFEGLPNKLAKKFPLKFLSAIPVGVDLNKIKIPFLIFIVQSVKDNFDHDKFSTIKIYIDNILKSLKSNNFDNPEHIAAAADAADANAHAYTAFTADAAADAADANAHAYTAFTADAAAYTAAYTAAAAYTAYTAADAAYTAAANAAANAAASSASAYAAAAADAAAAAVAAADAAASAAAADDFAAAYGKMAKKLISLIKSLE